MAETTILRLRNGDTDKCWVMIPDAELPGVHHVFFGKSGWDGAYSSKLQLRSVSGDAFNRIQKKFREGYETWQGVDFDYEKGRVVLKGHSTSNPPNHTETKPTKKPRLWLKVNHVSIEALTDFFTEIRQGLEDGNIAYNLENDPIYKDLVIQGKKTGQYEYGTQEALILFSLQRRFDGVFVSDDDNEMLPERFSELKAFIKHKIAPALLNNVDDYLQQWGVAMLCIDKPIDLSKIQSESAAAFF